MAADRGSGFSVKWRVPFTRGSATYVFGAGSGRRSTALVVCSSDVGRVAAETQYPKDQDVVPVEAIEDAVRKLPPPRPPDAWESVDRGCAVREGEQPVDDEVELVEELMLQVLADRASNSPSSPVTSSESPGGR